MPGFGWAALRGIAQSSGTRWAEPETPGVRAVVDKLNGLRQSQSLYSKNRRRGTPAPGKAGCAETRLNANSPRNCCVNAQHAAMAIVESVSSPQHQRAPSVLRDLTLGVRRNPLVDPMAL